MALALAVTACTPSGPSTGAQGRPSGVVVVGSFNFPESVLLGEIFTQALGAAGVPAMHQRQVGPREIMQPALEQGLVDVVPEYLGSALVYLDPASAGTATDPSGVKARLGEVLSTRALTALDFAPAQNQNGIAVTLATAAQYQLSAVSDLAPVADELVFVGPPECRERPYCLPGLRTTYGLEFQGFMALDSGGSQTRTALVSGDADVGLLFTTDGHVSTGEFVLLADDRSLQPPENIIPVVRQSVLQRWGEQIRQRLNAVSAALTTDDLAAMNAATGIDGVDPASAAATWLTEAGLTTS